MGKKSTLEQILRIAVEEVVINHGSESDAKLHDTDKFCPANIIDSPCS
jgi:hypothetical protein